jgi:hypothetical protein
MLFDKKTVHEAPVFDIMVISSSSYLQYMSTEGKLEKHIDFEHIGDLIFSVVFDGMSGCPDI